MTQSVYVTAVSQPPTIVCPAWCTVPTLDHIADLADWEGQVIHWSDDRSLLGPDKAFAASIARGATVDGVETEDDRTSIHVYFTPDSLTPQEAIEAGKALIALAEEALA